MTRKICSVFLSILFIAACSTEQAPEKKQEITQAPSERKLRVLNPAPPNRMVDRIPLTPRLDTLEGKTIFLVDIGWGGKDAAPSIYKEIKAWFAENIPSVKIEVRGIKGFYMQPQPELLKEISEKGDAAMFGIAG
ncbi:hypothetical protein ACFL1N_01230 [Thermodesulfobacteriota bacterium]